MKQTGRLRRFECIFTHRAGFTRRISVYAIDDATAERLSPGQPLSQRCWVVVVDLVERDPRGQAAYRRCGRRSVEPDQFRSPDRCARDGQALGVAVGRLMSPILDRRRVQDLERPVRELQGRILDLGVSAGRTRRDGATLTREDEIELLSRVLDEAVLTPAFRSAFTERLLALLQSRGGREGGSGSPM